MGLVNADAASRSVSARMRMSVCAQEAAVIPVEHPRLFAQSIEHSFTEQTDTVPTEFAPDGEHKREDTLFKKCPEEWARKCYIYRCDYFIIEESERRPSAFAKRRTVINLMKKSLKRE